MTRTMWNVEGIGAGQALPTLSMLSRAARLTAVLLAITAAVGCSRVAQLQASRAAKAANTAYAAQDYSHAAELYIDAINKNPDLAFAYFYLGNSYEQQYKPSRRGEADND